MMNIDINFLRGISTIFVMLGFLGITLWAYSSRRKQEFDQAAQMPFADDDETGEEKVVKKHE